MAARRRIPRRRELEREAKRTHPRSPAPMTPALANPAARVMALQRTVGNRAVCRLAAGGALQQKLRVGPAGDRYEREADRVADEVLRGLGAPVLSPGERVRADVSRSALAPLGLAGGLVEPGVEASIQQSRGRGQALPAAVRQSMERSFGTDLGAVRVHTGDSADALNRSMQSRAFTVGNDIYFAGGQYQPHRSGGQRLLAHELTHTLQQGGVARPSIVQRAVGFEFEDGYWRPWEVEAKPDPNVKKKKPEPALFVDPVPRKGVIYSGSKWELQGDDTPGPQLSNVEYVTEKFEETDAGLKELKKALRQMETVATRLGPFGGDKAGPVALVGKEDELSQLGRPPYVLSGSAWKKAWKKDVSERKKAAKKKAKKRASDEEPITLEAEDVEEQPAPETPLDYLDQELFVQPGQHKLGSGAGVRRADLRMSGGYAATPSFRVKMQASFGVTLRSLPEVMKAMGAPVEGEDKPSFYEYLSGKGHQDAPVHLIPSRSPGIGREALALLLREVELDDEGGLAKLHGFLSAVVSAVLALQRIAQAEPKTFFLMMPRTSFAAMFESLGDVGLRLAGQGKLVTEAVIEAINASNVLKDDVGTVTGGKDLTADTPLIGRNAPAASLTIGAWLRGVCDEGRDYLIASQLAGFLSDKGVSARGIESAKGHMESFGSVEEGDIRPDTKEFLAVFEHRGIDPFGGKFSNVMLPFDEAKERALAIFAYFQALRELESAPPKRKKRSKKKTVTTT